MSNLSMASALRPLMRQAGPSKRISTLPRQFSSTARNAVRAIFSETDNVELNTILNSIQETIILPAHLPTKQRKLVFNPRNRSHLEQNPIIIEVEGLEHKFSPIDRSKDIENSKTALFRALTKMQSAEDWANLPTLLAGYQKAGIKLKDDHMGRIARLAGTNGQIYNIIECAKQSSKTGLLFRTPEIAVRTLASINDKITESSWDANETKQALKWTETVLDLLQRPEHAPIAQNTRDRLHFSRLVRGLALFARASAAKVGQVSEREMNLLKDEVALLVSLWGDVVNKDLWEVPEFASLNPTVERYASEHGGSTRHRQALPGSAYVQTFAQYIKGIELAEEVLGGEAKPLSPILNTLKSHLQDFATRSPSKADRWEEEYEKVMGSKPNWPTAEPWTPKS